MWSTLISSIYDKYKLYDINTLCDKSQSYDNNTVYVRQCRIFLGGGRRKFALVISIMHLEYLSLEKTVLSLY